MLCHHMIRRFRSGVHSGLACIVAALLASQAGAVPGDLDPYFAGFGNGGQVEIDDHVVTGMAVQSDGKIVLTLDGTSVEVMRLLANGDPDPAFSGDGLTALSNPAFSVTATCVAIQSDGKIVVAGRADAEPGHFMLARLTPAGLLDTTFDGDGWVTTDFDNDDDHASAILIQPDGKIVVAGQARVNGSYDFAAARYLPSGALDPFFGGDGKVNVDFGDTDGCSDIALQEDGTLVLAGFNAADDDYDFAVARLHSDGSLDTNFSSDGKVLTGFGDYELAHGVAIQPDGKIVVVGFYNHIGTLPGRVARYHTNGALDTSFDGDGLLTNTLSRPSDVAVQPDGRIVLLGTHKSAQGDFKFAFQRLNPNGSFDASFAGSGTAFRDFVSTDDYGFNLAVLPDGRIFGVGHRGTDAIGLVRLWPDGSPDAGGQQTLAFESTTFPAGSDETMYGMAMQADGRTIVVGTVVTALGTESDFALARFLPNGLLDGTFGVAGRVELDIHNVDVGRAVAVQPDGRIVVAGHVGAGDANFVVARFTGDGALDTTFGFGGFNVVDFAGDADYARAIAVAPDGKIVVAGNAGALIGTARFNANGTLDTSFDGDGKQTFVFPNSFSLGADAVIVQSDRKVVVGGKASDDFALVRFLENGSVDPAFGATGPGYTKSNMGGFDAIHALVLGTSYLFAAGGGGANQDFALARYTSNGVLAGCPTHGCTAWPAGKAFADWGGSETAWSIDARGGRLIAAGCVNGLLGWAQFTETLSTNPLKGTADFVGNIECVDPSNEFSVGGAAVQYLFQDKAVLAATQNYNSDRNFALASFELFSFIASDSGDEEEVETSRGRRLQPAFPNPLVRQSVFAFDLPQAQVARMCVYDVAGRMVRTLAEGAFTAGRHQRIWDGTDQAGMPVAAGVYFARLEAGAIREQRSVVVLR